MRLLNDMIHAAPDERELSKTISIPEELKTKMMFGTRVWRVLATGPGRRNRKGVVLSVEARPGDRIVTVTDHAPNHELPDGSALIPESNVIAIIRDE